MKPLRDSETQMDNKDKIEEVVLNLEVEIEEEEIDKMDDLM